MREQWDFPFEREAGQNLPLPEGLSLADRMAYSALRNIYRAFHAGDIGRDRAGEEKQRLRRAWEQARESEAFERKLCAYHTRLRGSGPRAAAGRSQRRRTPCTCAMCWTELRGRRWMNQAAAGRYEIAGNIHDGQEIL